MGRAEPAIRDIAVFGADGALASHLDALHAPPPPLPRLDGARWASADQIALRQDGRTLLVRFDPRSLLVERDEAVTAGQAKPAGISAQVPGWPLWVLTPMDETRRARLERRVAALSFRHPGPGGGRRLAVGSVRGRVRPPGEGRGAIKALKSTRPVEARLMVRLANAERGASEALRAKSEFIAHMSHELRTPLNAIIGFSEIIAGGFMAIRGHPKYGEYARDIGDAGRDLHDKIGDILEFANIEAGPFSADRRGGGSGRAGAQSCVEEQQGRAFSRRIAMCWPSANPAWCAPITAPCAASCPIFWPMPWPIPAEGGFVRAEVRFEDGAGVSPSPTAASASRAENRAGRLRALRPRRHRPGAGLGLAIAMELARRMGGAMRLASDPGGGAAMDVRLPKL